MSKIYVYTQDTPNAIKFTGEDGHVRNPIFTKGNTYHLPEDNKDVKRLVSQNHLVEVDKMVDRRTAPKKAEPGAESGANSENDKAVNDATAALEAANALEDGPEKEAAVKAAEKELKKAVDAKRKAEKNK